MTITPEMLLGALVIFAIVLLLAVIIGTVWARSALKFGKGFQSFTAKRERNTINVQAVFDDAARSRERPTAARLGDWLSGRQSQVDIESAVTVNVAKPSESSK